MALGANPPAKPDKLLTAFAGMERDAANHARSYLIGYQPSSPMIALVKDGEPVHVLERHHIEGQMPDAIAMNLQAAFEEYCK
jgi:putative YphP/YqiW family bacilliredoxin